MRHKDKIFLQDELRGKSFEGVEFVRCKFRGVSLRFSNFEKCKFESCDFTGVILDNSGFEECSFAGSKLSNLSFAETQIKTCDFTDAVIINGVFQQLKPGEVDIRVRYDLRECRFERTDLSRSVFVKCYLKGVSFRDANLSQVEFEECDMVESDLVGADIRGTSFDTSKIEKTLLDMEGFVRLGNSKGFVLGG